MPAIDVRIRWSKLEEFKVFLFLLDAELLVV